MREINGKPDTGAFPIAADDRGFRYGDGLFETLRLAGGALWQEDFHWARLAAGLEALHLPPLLAAAQASARRVAAGAQSGGLVRIAISRGSGGRGYLPPADATPLLVVERLPPPSPAGPMHLLLSRWRKPGPESLPPGVKHSSCLNAVLARQEAALAGCDEALQLSVQGHVAELASGNIFWFREGRLYTPSLATGALPGSVRHWVMRREAAQEGFYAPAHLLEAEAAFGCNVGWGIRPIAALGPRRWGEDARVQALAQELRRAWGAA